MFRQYDLRSDDHRLTCWLPVDHRLRRGVMLRLKEDPEQRWWEVLRVGQVHLPAPPDRKWQVGGLL